MNPFFSWFFNILSVLLLIPFSLCFSVMSILFCLPIWDMDVYKACVKWDMVRIKRIILDTVNMLGVCFELVQFWITTTTVVLFYFMKSSFSWDQYLIEVELDAF